MSEYTLHPIGIVASSLRDTDSAPCQGDEGAPEAWLVVDERFAEAARDLLPDAEVLVLTWLHQADREVLRVHPRGDPRRPEEGVFSTRSPDRPNPIGMHRVRIAAVEDGRILVRPLEAIDGTPVLDIKPVLHERER